MSERNQRLGLPQVFQSRETIIRASESLGMPVRKGSTEEVALKPSLKGRGMKKAREGGMQGQKAMRRPQEQQR